MTTLVWIGLCVGSFFVGVFTSVTVKAWLAKKANKAIDKASKELKEEINGK